MSLIVPAASASARSLTGVAWEMVAAVSGEADDAGGLAPARSAVLFIVDGLGAAQLRGHAGHARFLAPRAGKKNVARTVFPSTTAAALSSILTGAWPGEHGLVGYRVLDPSRGILVNQLSGWEREGIDPATWQRVPTVFERVAASGRRAFAVGLTEYADSGFTRAVLRGAQYVPVRSPADRVATAWDLAASHPGAFVYCYLPELDKAGHKHGVDSDQWVTALEDVDAALTAPAPSGVGGVVTADHGMVDVPRHRHVLLREGDARLDGVAHVGGEPRMLHLYLADGQDADEAAERWSRLSAGAADVATRDAAVAAGLFGDVHPGVRARIGDVLVAARGRWAFYDDRLPDKRPQDMIGQHGSTTHEETIVPWLRLGAFAN